MISLDETLLDENASLGDARERHIAYAEELERLRPGSTLHILVRADRDGPAQAAGASLRLYPVGRSGPAFIKRGYRMGGEIAQAFPPNLITTQTPFLDGLLGYLLKWRWGAPLLVQLHVSRPDDPAWLQEQISNRLRYQLARWVMRHADGIRVTTESTRQWLAEAWGISSDRVYVHPVAPAQMQSSSTDQAPEPTVLYVGRLSPEKGVDVLVTAFAQVVDRLSKAHLVIVGDGEEREALENLTTKLGIQGNVDFMGAVSPQRLPSFYQQAWLVALPSRHESYGRVILEAFALGRPVIATDTEGARTLIRDGTDGIIVPRENPTALAAGIVELLQDPARAQPMGQAGRSAVGEMEDVHQLRQALVKTWVELAERH